MTDIQTAWRKFLDERIGRDIAPPCQVPLSARKVDVPKATSDLRTPLFLVALIAVSVALGAAMMHKTSAAVAAAQVMEMRDD